MEQVQMCTESGRIWGYFLAKLFNFESLSWEVVTFFRHRWNFAVQENQAVSKYRIILDFFSLCNPKKLLQFQITLMYFCLFLEFPQTQLSANLFFFYLCENKRNRLWGVCSEIKKAFANSSEKKKKKKTIVNQGRMQCRIMMNSRPSISNAELRFLQGGGGGSRKLIVKNVWEAKNSEVKCLNFLWTKPKTDWAVHCVSR